MADACLSHLQGTISTSALIKLVRVVPFILEKRNHIDQN